MAEPTLLELKILFEEHINNVISKLTQLETIDKTVIANAITAKGVVTTPDMTAQQMAEKVNSLVIKRHQFNLDSVGNTTDRNIDVKSIVSDYTKLTVNNFVLDATGGNCNNNTRSMGLLTRSYNKDTGIFTYSANGGALANDTLFIAVKPTVFWV